MKKLLIILLLSTICFQIIPEDEGSNISEKWVKIQKRQRVYHKRRELIQLDKQALEALDKSDIPENVEKDLAELLSTIIVDNREQDPKISIKAFDILQKQFKDKEHFYDIASEYAYSYSPGNPFIIVKILNGFSELLDNDYAYNVYNMKVVYAAIKLHFIYRALEGGDLKYGTDSVVSSLIQYLRTFAKKVNSNEIKIDEENMKTITDIYSDLNLEDRNSNFLKLPGAKELPQEYFNMNDEMQTSKKKGKDKE